MPDIVISAQNQASTILEDVGRSTHILGKDIQKLSDTSKASFSSMTGPLASIHAGFASFTSLLGPVAAIGAGFAAFKTASAALSSVTSFISDSANAFGEAEDASRKLTTAINLSGTATDESMAKHTELANAIQRELNIEDEQTMALMAQASLLGVTDDKLDDVTKTAIGLSEAMGISLDDGLKKARLALEGNFIGIDKLVPSIKELSTNEEKLAATLALAEKGLTVKKEAALAASQADERMGLAFGEFMESVGAAILPLQELVYNGLEIVITTLNTAFGPAIANAGGFFESFTENVVAGAQWLAESIIGAVTFIEVAWNNVGTVFELAGSVILLTIETLRADIEQALTVVIPAYATWFADNFFNIMRDVSMAVVSVFSNLGAIIGEIFGQIWLVITGQQTLSGAMEEVGRAAGRGLLYGFEATTAPLPEIASRAMTDTEKILNESMEQSATTIMDEFQTKFDERIGLLRSDLKDSPLTAKIELTSDKTKLDKLAQNKDSKAAKESRVKTDDTVLAASESRLLSRGKVDNAAGAETAANTATLVQQNSELREQMRVMNLSLSRISSNTEEMDVEEVS